MCSLLAEGLRRNRKAILRDLDPSKSWNYLYQEGIFDLDDIEEIKAERTRKKKAEALLEKVEHSGHDGIALFAETLRESQSHLFDLLQSFINDTGPHGGQLQAGQPTIAQVTHQVSDLHIYREPVSCVQKALSPVEHVHEGIDRAFEKISSGDLSGSLETNQERGENYTPAEERLLIARFDFSKLPPHIHPHSEDVYPMTATPRGLALIINNESFVRGSEQTEKEFEKEKLEVRQGSEKDTISLQRLFEALDFKVRVNRNVTEKQLLKVLDDVSKDDHSDYHCFVLCLMSHGKEGQFYCADGKTVCLKEISNFFSNRNCETLKGKPKLFFIQACRGYVKDRGVVEDSPSEQGPQQASGENDEGPVWKFSFERDIIPNQADMLMAYSTVSGYASFRNPTYGSRFVRCLVEVFQEKASHEDVLSMLTNVNDKLSKMGEIDSKQVGQPTSTLRKKVYFWPGL